MSKFKKKPVEIEAFKLGYDSIPEWFMDKVSDNTIILNSLAPADVHIDQRKDYFPSCTIRTLEGEMMGDTNDYIIKGVKGEVYPCKPDIFEMTYVESKAYNLTFGEALELLRQGSHLAREGWNGKNQFIVYQKGYPQGINCNKQTAQAWGMKEGDLFKCEPYLQIQTVDLSHAMWVPSVSDILAGDWKVVD